MFAPPPHYSEVHTPYLSIAPRPQPASLPCHRLPEGQQGSVTLHRATIASPSAVHTCVWQVVHGRRAGTPVPSPRACSYALMCQHRRRNAGSQQSPACQSARMPRCSTGGLRARSRGRRLRHGGSWLPPAARVRKDAPPAHPRWTRGARPACRWAKSSSLSVDDTAAILSGYSVTCTVPGTETACVLMTRIRRSAPRAASMPPQ